jgi:hypothetical protein
MNAAFSARIFPHRPRGRQDEEDGIMRSTRSLLHRIAIAGVIAAVAGMALGGCGQFGPSETWIGDTGTLGGAVRSAGDQGLAGIDIYLWTELGKDARQVEYWSETDSWGQYRIDGIEMASPHSFAEVYDIYVNRTPGDPTAINSDYTTYWSSVTILDSEPSWADIVIEYVGGPEDPEHYIEQ